MHADTFKDHGPATDLFLVKPWMAFCAGILLWLPGVGLPVRENVYLQPLELFIIGWTFLWAIPAQFTSRKVRLSKPILIICGVLLASWVISTVWSNDQSRSILILSYYSLCILPGILLFYFIAINGFLFVQFVSGFIFGALASCIVGFLQLVPGMHVIRLVNNSNYSLVYGLRKASGFTPEASILAGLLIIAIMIVLALLGKEDIRIYCDRHNIPAYLAKKKWIGLTLFILLSGLFATLSSSVIFILPIVVLAGYMMLNNIQHLRKVLIMAFCLIFIVVLFIGIAWSTRSSEDSIDSIILRFAAIVAAIKIAVANWLHGVGLGMLKVTIGQIVHQNIQAWDVGQNLKLWVQHNHKDGVDSFALHLIAEQGVIMLGLFIVAFRWILSGRHLGTQNGNGHELLAMISILGLSVFLVGSFTVGYRGLFHLWLIFPVAAAIRNFQGSKAR